MARLEGIKKSQGSNGFSNYLFDLEKNLQEELLEILHQEELFWMMKSRDNWLVEGDRNTSFFHKSVFIKRSKNRIISLCSDVGD